MFGDEIERVLAIKGGAISGQPEIAAVRPHFGVPELVSLDAAFADHLLVVKGRVAIEAGTRGAVRRGVPSAQMPLAEDGRVVAGVLHKLAEGWFRKIHPRPLGVGVKAETPCHQHHPGGTAHGSRVAGLETRTLGRKAIQIRGSIGPAAIDFNALATQIVRQDEDDVRPRGSFRSREAGEGGN